MDDWSVWWDEEVICFNMGDRTRRRLAEFIFNGLGGRLQIMCTVFDWLMIILFMMYQMKAYALWLGFFWKTRSANLLTWGGGLFTKVSSFFNSTFSGVVTVILVATLSSKFVLFPVNALCNLGDADVACTSDVACALNSVGSQSAESKSSLLAEFARDAAAAGRRSAPPSDRMLLLLLFVWQQRDGESDGDNLAEEVCWVEEKKEERYDETEVVEDRLLPGWSIEDIWAFGFQRIKKMEVR